MTALATAAGKSLPINMTTCWYGYNDSLVVTPTSIINIPAADFNALRYLQKREAGYSPSQFNKTKYLRIDRGKICRGKMRKYGFRAGISVYKEELVFFSCKIFIYPGMRIF